MVVPGLIREIFRRGCLTSLIAEQNASAGAQHKRRTDYRDHIFNFDGSNMNRGFVNLRAGERAFERESYELFRL